MNVFQKLIAAGGFSISILVGKQFLKEQYKGYNHGKMSRFILTQ